MPWNAVGRALLACLASCAACASTVTLAPGSDGGAGDGSSAPGDGGARDASRPPRDVSLAPDDIDTLPEAAAESACATMFRCCDATARRTYFDALTYNDRATPELRAELPPADEAACRRVLAAALRTAVFVDWIDAVRRGLVRYAPEGSLACRSALEEASCGESSDRALFDPTCFTLYDSGFQQRRMFQRVATEGQPCRAVREWQYPYEFFGTCDPAVAFCCLADPADPSHCLDNFGSRRLGVSDGRCRRVSQLGDACAGPLVSLEGLQLCARGLVCGLRSHRCFPRAPETPLALGDPCYDYEDGRVLGRCPDGPLACDLYRLPEEGTATLRCVAAQNDGQPCSFSGECRSNHCARGVCAPPERYCGSP